MLVLTGIFGPIRCGGLVAHCAFCWRCLFCRYGYTHIDIPAQSLAYCTLITGVLSLLGVMTLGGGLVVPIVVEAWCIIWSVAYETGVLHAGGADTPHHEGGLGGASKLAALTAGQQ